MFKIVKILNGTKSAAETVNLKVTEAVNYKVGTPAIISSGKVTPCSTATTKPTHLIAENLKAGDAATVRAYVLTQDTVLETKVYADPSAIEANSSVTLHLVDGLPVGVTATTTNGVAKILDMCGAKAEGDSLFVRFI